MNQIVFILLIMIVTALLAILAFNMTNAFAWKSGEVADVEAVFQNTDIINTVNATSSASLMNYQMQFIEEMSVFCYEPTYNAGVCFDLQINAGYAQQELADRSGDPQQSFLTQNMRLTLAYTRCAWYATERADCASLEALTYDQLALYQRVYGGQ